MPKKLNKLLAKFCLISFFFLDSYAAEVYVFATKNCVLAEGVLIHVSGGSLKVLQRSGEVKALPRNGVKTILTYNIDIQRFGMKEMSHEAQKLLKKVRYLEGNEKKHFIGLPIKFIEEINFFYSIDGVIRIIGEGQINRIDSVRSVSFSSSPQKKRPLSLATSTYLPQCKLKANRGVRPTKIISDLVKIEEFISNFEKGLQSLEKFQDRTHLYTRPFYYDKRPMMGFFFSKETKFAPSFQWSSGSDYYFQSETTVIHFQPKYSAGHSAIYGVGSSAKSHFLNLSFEANLKGIPGGEPLKDKSGLQEEIEEIKKTKNDFALYPQFNHLFLLGGDWRNFTLKMGAIYNNMSMVVKKEKFAREIPAIKSSPIWELGYTQLKWKVALLFSWSSYNGNFNKIIHDKDLSPISKSVWDDENNEWKYVTEERHPNLVLPTTFDYSSKYLRGRGEYDFNDKVRLSVDSVFLKGRYKEFFKNGTINHKFKRISTLVSLTHTFGHYIQLTLQGNWVKDSLSFIDYNKDNSQLVWGGQFAFLF